ncbi:HAD superfamily hydrolase (TIGR01549 family) [Salirhabdus euzebyi]|uniref:HAD superfamily hydrolase (TIGR01549 family) n=1 Tax=Salirhabdus euzebyi TaxID=394506 RepID=A0A841Q3Z7_9BACI|nr:HAD family hydrolase [Salirhabdus euzebyi]MBB6453136.1 HAD superfamily hydrolase (TIGR01549 family) [Salirhabdus euzebyi]
MYKCVILDVDGTMLNTEKAIIYSLQQMLKEEFNRVYSYAELTRSFGIPGVTYLETLGIENAKAANDIWNEMLKDYQSFMEIFPGIRELLSKLKEKNILLGIVTSKTRQELKDDFFSFGLNDLFDYVVCADDTTKHKPNPEPILKFLEVSNVNARDAIYIGDTIYDSQCAKESKVAFGLAKWGAIDPENIPSTFKFDEPRHILNLFEK